MDSIKSFKGYGKVDEAEDRALKRKTRTRIILIAVSAIALVAIVVGVAVVATANKGGSEGDARPQSFASSVKAICSVTQYPDSCFASISSIKGSNSTSDPEELFRLSLQVASDALSKLASLADSVTVASDDKRLEAAVRDCRELFHDAVDRLQDSISSASPKAPAEKLLTEAKISDLKTWLSAALTNQETCLDGFDGTTGDLHEKFEAAMTNSTQFASNSLAIVAGMMRILHQLDFSLHRKLLQAERGAGYNKKVLNVFPFPWLTSTLSLACGSLMMLISWTLRIAEAPKTDMDFWKALAPVAVAHTIGHVAATVSMSKVAVSFTHIIKSGEPAFSVLVSRFLLGETFPFSVYLSLIPIIGGCALAAVTELNFNMIGFMGAMISNIAFVFRNIFSKRGMSGKSVSGMNYYACLSMLSLLILTPFAIAVEGPKMWAVGWQNAMSQIGPNFIWWVAAQSIFYHLYNQVSYMSLDEISPLTFSIGNTMKRISVIVSSIIIFQTPVQPVNALGAVIAVLGTFLYSQAKQ